MSRVISLTMRITSWWRSREGGLGDLWPFLLPAYVLYLIRLGFPPLWYDEAASLWFAQLPLARMIIGTAADTHPPLYYLLLAAVGHLAGWSPFMLRLPSVIFALVSLYLMREIGRELKFSQTAQLIAIGLMVLSPFELHYAQEARMYALLQMLVLGATLSLLRWQLLRFSLLSALSLWTHNYGLFYLAINCGLFAWQILKTRPRSPVFETAMATSIIGGATILMWSPWALVLYQQMRIVSGGYWIQPITFGGLVYSLVNLMYAFTLPNFLAPVGVIVAVGLLLWLLIKVAEVRDETALVLAWLAFAPAVLAVIVSFVWRPIFLFRGLSPSVPALFLLAGWALARVPRLHQIYAALLIVPLFAGAIIGQYLWTPAQKSEEDKTILAALRAQMQPGDLVVHSNEGYIVEWYPLWSDISHQVILPRCAASNWGAMSTTTRNAFGMVVTNPEMLQWDRAWFIFTVFPTITQCEVDRSNAFLAAHPHQLWTTIRGDDLVNVTIWLVNRH